MAKCLCNQEKQPLMSTKTNNLNMWKKYGPWSKDSERKLVKCALYNTLKLLPTKLNNAVNPIHVVTPAPWTNTCLGNSIWVHMCFLKLNSHCRGCPPIPPWWCTGKQWELRRGYCRSWWCRSWVQSSTPCRRCHYHRSSPEGPGHRGNQLPAHLQPQHTSIQSHRPSHKHAQVFVEKTADILFKSISRAKIQKNLMHNTWVQLLWYTGWQHLSRVHVTSFLFLSTVT